MKEEKENKIKLWAVYRVYHDGGKDFPPFQTLGFSVEIKKLEIEPPEKRVKSEFRKAALEKHGEEPNFKKVVYVKYFFKESKAEKCAKKMTNDEKKRKQFSEFVKEQQSRKE